VVSDRKLTLQVRLIDHCSIQRMLVRVNLAVRGVYTKRRFSNLMS